MHFAVRAPCLFVAGLIAVAVSILLGMLSDLWGHLSLFDQQMFWERTKAFPCFQVVMIATLLSMLLPTYFYGMNRLSDRRYSRGGWGGMPALAIFLVMSIVILPLMMVFQPDDDALRPAFMSRQAYVLPFFFLWWVHGGINAYHVHVLARNFENET